jgi:DHA3 family macrolide efflux protein-like MFS transporter
LLFFRIPQPPRSDSAQLSVWQDFRGGLRLVTSNRGLLMLYGVVALMVMVLMPAFVIVPLLVLNEFGGGVNEVALMEGISGIGLIVGGILAGIVALPKRRIVVVLASFALACITITFTGLTPGNLFWLAIVWWFISGLTFSFANAPVIVIIQTIVPPQMQGRAFSLFSTFIGLSGPLGLMLAAPLGEFLDVRAMLIGGGFLATLVCLLAFLSPHLMKIDEQTLSEVT